MEGSKVRQFFSRMEEYLHSIYAKKVILMFASFFSGLLCSRGLVFGKYAPFGIAAAAAVPKGGMWAAVFGAFFGYLLPSPVYISIRYEAALLAVAAIRWSLSELKSVNTHPLYAPAVTFLPLLLTGVTMVLISGSVNYSAALYVAEAFLGAGVAYFLRRTANLLQGLSGNGDSKSSGLYDSGDVAALAVSVGILALSFSSVSIAGVSMGRIFMVLMIIYCARVGGISGGSSQGRHVGSGVRRVFRISSALAGLHIYSV